MTKLQVQAKQEEQYQFPYHYIPDYSLEEGFSSRVTWSWGAHYLAGLEAVLTAVDKVRWESLCDVGCGDGRFLKELNRRYSNVRLCGIDYSERAISLARALNPDIDYRALDIVRSPIAEVFDLCTMIEVLEHIPPDSVPEFLKAVNGIMNPDGRLILTVPHKNKKVSEKHFQHFDRESLEDALVPSFEVLEIRPFDGRDKISGVLRRVLGINGKNFQITNKTVNNWYYRRILRNCLNERPEEKCGRLLAIGQPRHL